MDRGQECFEIFHLRDAYLALASLEILERAVKIFDSILVSPPVKGFVPDDILQSLCYHRPFHRVKLVRRSQWETRKVPVRDAVLRVAERTAQIPCQPVEARIDVTRSARRLAQTGCQMRIVKDFTSRAYRLWRGIA